MPLFVAPSRPTGVLATALSVFLAGCAGVDIDREVAGVNASHPTFTQGALNLAQDASGRAARARETDRLLADTLGREESVRLALANSPELQALLAQHLQICRKPRDRGFTAA